MEKKREREREWGGVGVLPVEKPHDSDAICGLLRARQPCV